MNFKVTYFFNYGLAWVDPNPIIKYFEFEHELEDWIFEEVQRRVDVIVKNSVDTVSDKERRCLEEEEWSHIKIEEV